MLKKVLYGIIILVVVLLIIGYFLFSRMDGLLKAAVEKVGSETTATSVKLGGLKTKLKTGEVDLSNFRMSNPQGYSQAQPAVSFKTIVVSVDPQSLSKNVIVINKVLIESPFVFYQMKGSSSNLQQIQANVQNYINQKTANKHPQSQDQQAKKPEKTAKKGSEKKFIIRDLSLTDGNILVSSPLLKGKDKTVSLPNIHLTNVGNASGGLTAEQLSAQLINIITANAGKAAANAGIEKAKQKLTDQLKEKADGLLKNILP